MKLNLLAISINLILVCGCQQSSHKKTDDAPVYEAPSPIPDTPDNKNINLDNICLYPITQGFHDNNPVFNTPSQKMNLEKKFYIN